MTSRTTITLISTLALIAAAAQLLAGPINPPAGPVAPTGKTTQEIFDKAAQAAQAAAAAESRIAVSAANTPGDAQSIFKITQPGSYYLTGNLTGVAGKHGIVIASPGVTLDLNGFDLAGIPGMGAFAGIFAANTAHELAISNGVLHAWGGPGIDLLTNNAHACRVSGIRAYSNAGPGILVGHSSTVTDCQASNNTGHGIQCGSDCVVSNSTAVGNHASGFYSTGLAVIFTHCASFENTLAGFHVDLGASVLDCQASYNKADGIECTSQGAIRGNTCTGNGWNGGSGAGIHVAGARNRIESNHCTLSTRGIDVDGAANIIIRNTCSGNGVNWTIAAFNAVAPIIAASSNQAAINGNSYAGSLGSADPSANFTH